jgi:Flp pilus assembly pilin Flp
MSTRLAVNLMTRSYELQDRAIARAKTRHGVSMIEYVLIAGIVLVIAGVLSTVLRPSVTGLIDRIKAFLDSQG